MQLSSGNCDYIVVGQLTSAHGIRGGIKARSFTEVPTDLLNYKQLYIRPTKAGLRRSDKTPWKPVTFASSQVQAKHFLVFIEGVNDRTAAEAYRQYDIAIQRSELPDLPSDQYYWHQLIDLYVISTYNDQQQLLGQVSDLMETGSNDVLIVKPCKDSIDERERLIPYTDDCIQRVDIGEKMIFVDWDPEF